MLDKNIVYGQDTQMKTRSLQWDLQMQQVGGAVQEVISRITALTAGIEAEPVED
jgi:hypothetical protein